MGRKGSFGVIIHPIFGKYGRITYPPQSSAFYLFKTHHLQIERRYLNIIKTMTKIITIMIITFLYVVC